jgi:hypothetical protein
MIGALIFRNKSRKNWHSKGSKKNGNRMKRNLSSHSSPQLQPRQRAEPWKSTSKIRKSGIQKESKNWKTKRFGKRLANMKNAFFVRFWSPKHELTLRFMKMMSSVHKELKIGSYVV